MPAPTEPGGVESANAGASGAVPDPDGAGAAAGGGAAGGAISGMTVDWGGMPWGEGDGDERSKTLTSSMSAMAESSTTIAAARPDRNKRLRVMLQPFP